VQILKRFTKRDSLWNRSTHVIRQSSSSFDTGLHVKFIGQIHHRISLYLLTPTAAIALKCQFLLQPSTQGT